MKKLRKQFRYGEKGFTLIELLVVVAILGVLAAVVVPNVVKFMGTGTEESANTEAHDVQLAVVASMADNNLTDITGTVGPDGDVLTSTPLPAANSFPRDFLVNPLKLQAIYSFVEGEMTAATSVGITGGSKWTGLVWTVGGGWAEPE